MKTLNKTSAYARLATIREQHHVDVSKYMREVAGADSVPVSTLVFINKYCPIDQLYTYNKIYQNRKKNPLYKNLVNENLPDSEKAIALSSFVTQVMIHCKELINQGKYEDHLEYIEIMNINGILDALREYSIGNIDKLNTVFYEIRRSFKNLF